MPKRMREPMWRLRRVSIPLVAVDQELLDLLLQKLPGGLVCMHAKGWI